MRVQVLGGSPPHLSRDGIGPIGMLLPDLGILVDYGIGHRRLPEGEAVITPFPIPADQEIRYVILTHIHNDHAGLVPWVMKRFPKAELVTTLPTLELGRAVWSDLHAIGRRRGYPGLVPWNTSLYEEICRRTIIVREPGWIDLEKGTRVYFCPNGHVRGSAYVVVESGGKRVAWSGDVSYYDTPTVLGMKAENVPEEIRGVDALFLESTHGDREVEPRSNLVDHEMNPAINETLFSGGIALEVALSIERAQDVALDQVRGGILPVYLDSKLAEIAWKIYLSKEGSWSPNDIPIDPVLAKRVISIHDRAGEEDGSDFREKLLRSGKALSIVSSAGSLQGGPSVSWAKRVLPDPRSLIVQCNYQFEGTPGADLEKYREGVSLDLGGTLVSVKSRVLRVDLSAHAGRSALRKIASWFEPKRLILYHGIWSACRHLQRHIMRPIALGRPSTLERPPEIPVNGELIEI